MDKPRDVRRGASRFSTARLRIKQSAHKLFGGLKGIGGDFEFSEKSKKGKVRSLSAVGRALSSHQACEMGCDVSEKVDALPPEQSPSSSIIPTGKRFKISKKVFDDCNGVDHASVPRRLRSAMKKRSRECGLLDSEKVNHKLNGIESPEKNGIKKTKVSTKQGSSDWSTRQTVSGTITKDEEEVVETLYALAGMFPNSGSNDTDSSKLDGDSLPENSVLQDVGNSTNAAFEASEIALETHPSCGEGSPREAAKTNSLNEAICQKQSELLDNARFSLASDGVDPKLDLQTMPTLVRSENGNEVAMKYSRLRLAMGLDMPKQSPILHIERKPEMTVETARALECEQEHHMIKDQKKNGILWPDLSLAASAGSHASYMQSSASKAPVWLDATICASKQALMHRVSSGGKISKVIHKKSWKRCVAHVHISNYIRSLQVPNSEDTLLQLPNQTDQLRANEGSRHGVVMEVHNLNTVRSGITSASGTGHSDSVMDSHETKNCNLQQPRRYLDLSKEADQCGPQKQSFDILSLSAGGNELKVNNTFDKGGGGPLSTLQVPYFQALAQQHGLMRVPLPQSQYASTAYLDQLSVAGRQVVPQYYGNPLWGSANSLTTTSNKQQHQNFLAVQVGGQGQGRSGVNCNVMRGQYPNWESGRQAMVPHSPVVRSKLTPISEQQQQQLIALASSSRTNGLDFHLPSSLCDQSRGTRFGTPSLQLLCDDPI
ncbi:uncharacterized protein G2W53_031611 [Senna tora]|uniref:Uncharacterized protein n=1 Tax=Senna tora TaxID=362788 RepID=A0A834WCM2_9FABA|nr:uncharacterized protein G2W53_031611 [Senna tora]